MDITMSIAQLLIPVGLLIWQGKSPANSQIGWGLKTVLVLGYLVAIALAGLWLAIPWWVSYLYLGLWLVLAIVSSRSIRQQSRFPKSSIWAWTRVLFCGILAGLFWAVALHVWTGYQPPSVSPVALTFPLKNGTYYVANGGSNELLNSHLDLVRSKRLQELRGTMYAVDIVKLNPIGLRAQGLSPPDPAQYAIFGDPLYAPCDGVVLQSVNAMPDMSPPTVNREHEKGNFVMLQCNQDKAVIAMAHLRKGSVKVAMGDRVSTGQPLGEIGNSGESGEPHLHIHAQRLGSNATALDGEPLPMTFADRYLVRNVRVESR
jgi:Peptidase family M23